MPHINLIAMQDRSISSSFIKGLDLLTILARRPEGSILPVLRAKLKMPRSTTLRLLSTLELYGLAARRNGVWRATELFFEWSNRDTHKEIKDRYHDALRAIADEVNELVELGIAEIDGVRYIDWIQSNHVIAIDPLKSSLYPIHQTATGKLLLSQRPDLCAAIPDSRLREEIAEAGRTGAAWNRRESDPNVMAVATWAGGPSALNPVICVKWPFFRFTESKARHALRAIRRIVKQMG